MTKKVKQTHKVIFPLDELKGNHVRLGYVRVSTKNQSTDLQVRALEEVGCMELFEDYAVSGSINREAEGFRSLMARAKELRERNFEVEVCSTKLNRFSRNLADLIESTEELTALGVSYTAVDGGFSYDPSSAFSRFQLHIMGAIDEFEKERIHDRMDEGLEVAREEGMIMGPRPKANQATVDAVRADYASGEYTTRALEKKWALSRPNIYRILNIYGYGKPYVTTEQWDAARRSGKKK